MVCVYIVRGDVYRLLENVFAIRQPDRRRCCAKIIDSHHIRSSSAPDFALEMKSEKRTENPRDDYALNFIVLLSIPFGLFTCDACFWLQSYRTHISNVSGFCSMEKCVGSVLPFRKGCERKNVLFFLSYEQKKTI